MATKKKSKSTAQAAKQPVAQVSAEAPETLDTQRDDSAAAETTSQPGLGHGEQLPEAGVGGAGGESVSSEKSVVRAKDGVFFDEGSVLLEVVTRLPRRIRGGVIVTQVPQTVTVTEDVAALIGADPYIQATRK